MKQISVALLLLASASATFAEKDNIINLTFGGTWPSTAYIDSSDQNVVWNSSVEWGKIFDRRIIVGAKLDLAWHVISHSGSWNDEKKMYEASSNIYKKNRLFMVPISAWIGIDPLPEKRFHPVIHAQLGFNSLFEKQALYAEFDEVNEKDDFKYYKGLYSKFGIDGVFDLGASASIFAGFEYQIAPLYHKGDDDSIESVSYNAPAFRVGIQLFY